MQQLGDPVDVVAERRCDLGDGRFALQFLHEVALASLNALNVLDGVRRQPNVPTLLGHRSGDRLANPPRGVGGELEAAGVVELLDRFHEADVPALDGIGQRHAGAHEALGDAHDESQVAGDELLAGSLPGLHRSTQPAALGE